MTTKSAEFGNSAKEGERSLPIEAEVRPEPCGISGLLTTHLLCNNSDPLDVRELIVSSICHAEVRSNPPDWCANRAALRSETEATIEIGYFARNIRSPSALPAT